MLGFIALFNLFIGYVVSLHYPLYISHFYIIENWRISSAVTTFHKLIASSSITFPYLRQLKHLEGEILKHTLSE